MSKVISRGLAALLLLAVPAYAGDSAPLAPGKAAGVKQAHLENNVLLWTLAGAAVIGIVIAASSGGDNNTTPTTGTTS